VNPLKILFDHERNFYKLVADQAENVKEGIDRFTDWPEGCCDYQDVVFAAEEKADEFRTAVSEALREAFSTPFEREDIYDLSHMLDNVMDGARRAASEMAALEIIPDDSLRSMFKVVSGSMSTLAEAFGTLEESRKGAYDLAMKAKEVEKQMQSVYEKSMKALFEQDDLKEILKRREVYRLVLNIAVQIADLADFLRHLVFKLA